MANADEVIRLQAEEHPLVADDRPGSLEEHCLHLIHLKAYEQIGEVARGKVVLDVGCNNGYGTKEISRHAAATVGVDVSAQAIEEARRRYAADGIDFRVFDGAKLPFEDEHFDLVASFQVIEHIAEVDPYLSEIHRVLKPGGVAVFTTPNATIRLDPGAKPWNRFHVREYASDELLKTLQGRFPQVVIRGLLANEDLYAVEYNRCQRARTIARWRAGGGAMPTSPASLRAAVIGTALRLLPDRAVTTLRHILRIARRAMPAKTARLNRFSTADLFYGSGRLSDALDLMAVCHKAGATALS
jgi:SAM-dependent methyltransferase